MALAGACLLAACAQADRTLKPPHPPSDTTTTPSPAVQRTSGTPAGWSRGGIGTGYAVGTQRGGAHGGAAALYVTRPVETPPTTARRAGTSLLADNTFASVAQMIRAEPYRGRRMRWSGWVRATDVAGSGAGLWMRVDGPGLMLGFDNMLTRPVLGSTEWQRAAVVLDVPPSAIGISLGILLAGTGDILADDFVLEAVPDSVPVTNVWSTPQPGTDSATVAAWYARVPSTVYNPDFEGLSDVTAAAAAWLDSNAVRLATSDPGNGLADLEPLRGMVGSARLVGLGEGTHGTHEFFQLKRRLIEFLVTQLGFTDFAIEATWPEANDVNRYVLTGEGDPRRLLSRLYFWTWNTQEVLDLILWMRGWNASAAPERRVRFLGFDMQSPGAAMDTVASFVARVDTTGPAFLANRYACITPYRNYGAAFSRPPTEYAALPSGERGVCRSALEEVHQYLSDNGAAFRQATSDSAWAVALQSARVVQQFEEVAGAQSSSASSLARDRSMAENVQWLLARAGPGARMMLWAHNGHVWAQGGAMGSLLRSAFGDDYLNIGFAFGTGSFNAIEQSGSTFKSLHALTTNYVADRSVEGVFIATGRPLLLLDTRTIAAGGKNAAYLAGPLGMRVIGSAYNPAWEPVYFVSTIFPTDLQLLIFVRTSTPTTLLTFQYTASP